MADSIIPSFTLLQNSLDDIIKTSFSIEFIAHVTNYNTSRWSFAIRREHFGCVMYHIGDATPHTPDPPVAITTANVAHSLLNGTWHIISGASYSEYSIFLWPFYLSSDGIMINGSDTYTDIGSIETPRYDNYSCFYFDY